MVRVTIQLFFWVRPSNNERISGFKLSFKKTLSCNLPENISNAVNKMKKAPKTCCPRRRLRTKS